MSVLLGNGDGTFQPALSYPGNPIGSTFNPSLVVDDLDRDGRPDVAFAIGSPLRVLQGNGDGTFQRSQAFQAGLDPMSIAAADLNRDGVVDLMVGHRDSTNYVGILLGVVNSSCR